MHSKLNIQALLTFIRTLGQTKGVGLLKDMFPNIDDQTATDVYFGKLRIVLLNKEYYFYEPKK
jgi:hypothetical protein